MKKNKISRNTLLKRPSIAFSEKSKSSPEQKEQDITNPLNSEDSSEDISEDSNDLIVLMQAMQVEMSRMQHQIKTLQLQQKQTTGKSDRQTRAMLVKNKKKISKNSNTVLRGKGRNSTIMELRSLDMTSVKEEV